MTLLIAFIVVVVATAIAVSALLLVRRRAPEGGYFEDGDRAAGVFGVLATGFSVLLGFIVFLAFASYDSSASGAETEALVLVQQFETAQFLPATQRDELSGQLVCYGRSIVHSEWDDMEAGRRAGLHQPVGRRDVPHVPDVDPQRPSEQAAYSKWLDQTADREQARNDRLHGADGVVPAPLWIVLFLIAAVIFAFMLFFADRAERAVVQGMLIGSVTTVIVATMLLLWFLDNPYQSGTGGLRPTSMERSLEIHGARPGTARQRPARAVHGRRADPWLRPRPKLGASTAST